ncbi:MAG: hypothetical protein DYG89_15250 [Caldilinea sp. CFX5]|nr:hypothetical protein [Caldilinea sp. CFX5]
MMSAEIETGGNLIPWPNGVAATVERYGGTATTGFDQAAVAATGPTAALWALLRWLGHRLRIRDDAGQAVWGGLIHEVTLQLGAFEVGLSLEGMYNRIAVAYSTTDASGADVRATTAWAEDAESVARYGYKELLHTAADVSPAQAVALRDTLLATLSKPHALLRLNGGAPGAMVRAVGLLETFEWRYYSQAAGLEAHTEGGQEQALGQGLTATSIGFTQDGRLHDLGNRLDALPKDSNIQITGSASNNGTHLLNASGRDGSSYTANTIAIQPSDDLVDSAEGLNFLSANDIFQLTGSASHNGYYRVKGGGAAAITVAPNVGTEAAGAAITLTQAGSIRTSSVFVNEMPGATVTATVHGQKIAQSFSLAANTSWTVDQIALNLKKVGAPADGVTVQLCADASGAPGTVLVQTTVAAGSIYPTGSWVAFALGNVVTISYGVTYWIVIFRTGADNIDNYYIVAVDEDLGYGRGALRLWTGAAWTNRATNADLAFRVLGAWETTRQIQEIYNACNQHFTALDIVTGSGVSSNQYRVGDSTALTEVQALATAGAAGGLRLLLATTPDWVLRVEVQPTSGDNNLLLASDGRLRAPTGRDLPAGRLPTGQWVRLIDVPANVDALASLANIFVERAEWSNGALRLEPQGARSVWDAGAVTQG